MESRAATDRRALQGSLSFAGRLTAYPKCLCKCLILERLRASVRVMAAFQEATAGDGGLPATRSNLSKSAHRLEPDGQALAHMAPVWT